MKKTIYIILLSIIIVSCDNNIYYHNSQDFDNETWSVGEIVKSEVEFLDSLDVFNFYFVIRNTEDYPNMNLFLFLKTEYPNGQYSMDTLECMLADQSGKWYGKGNGKIKDTKILFKPKIRFSDLGSYKFEIQHGMRVDKLKGIKSAGILIESVK